MGNSTRTTKTVRWPIEPAVSDKKSSPDKATDKPAGRIMHDARGNAVYGRAAGDSTSTMLKRLEIPGLEVEGQEDTQKTPSPIKGGAAGAKATVATPREVAGGYNPYDQTKAVKKPTLPKGPVGKKR
jgi:hypothetical protein